MEARWLFDMQLSEIQVVVQPQSIIHSMVEFQDGAVIAQMGTPDMKIPIQYALYYPRRRSLPGSVWISGSLRKSHLRSLTPVCFAVFRSPSALRGEGEPWRRCLMRRMNALQQNS